MNFDPFLWFGTREMHRVPPHFIKGNTPLTTESKIWIENKLQGRYCITPDVSDEHDILFSNVSVVFFEDPKEAMLYELRWSGSK